MRPYAGPVATLGDLRSSTAWLWIYCEGRGCGHCAPVALAPFIIRWGEHASSDMLRRSAKCTCCGRKGATLRTPSWVNSQVGTAPFPVERMHALG
jgi:hypothetical protein